jgi:hypothetical protein
MVICRCVRLVIHGSRVVERRSRRVPPLSRCFRLDGGFSAELLAAVRHNS